MLVIKRKKGEGILLGDNINIKIIDIENGAVKIAIDAPKDIPILRDELYAEVKEENKKASEGNIYLLQKIKKET